MKRPTKRQIEMAINDDAADWALAFGVNDPAHVEARRRVTRGYVAAKYIKPLLKYLVSNNS